MGQADLHRAVRGVMQDAPSEAGRAVSDEQVDVAIRVVLAEVRQSIEALEGLEQADNDYWHGWIAHEAAVLAVIAGLVPPPLV